MNVKRRSPDAQETSRLDDVSASRFEAVQASVRQFSIAAQIRRSALPPGDGERTDFFVTGQKLTSLWVGEGAKVEWRDSYFFDEASISKPAGVDRSAVLQFENRTGTVLPVIGGYSYVIVMERDGIASINIFPTGDDDLDKNDLHATITAAEDAGVFRIEGPPDQAQVSAGALSRRIQDPVVEINLSLSIYAAYAYFQADLREENAALAAQVRKQLHGITLFDVAILAREIPLHLGSPVFQHGSAFCPLLRKGWNILRAFGSPLRPAAAAAHEHLLPSLWTTFTPQGVATLVAELQEGRL